MARDPQTVEFIAEAVGLKTWPSFVERACCDKKEVFLNGGWRGGKSSSAAFLVFIDIILKWLNTPGNHLIWLVGPDYAQARQEYFYLLDWLDRLKITAVGDVSKAMQGPLHASFSRGNGVIEIATKQAGDPTSLGSVAPVIILACEAGQISSEAKGWIQGRTAEKNATIIWSGTFENEEGKPQYEWFEEDSQYVMDHPSPRAQAFCLPTWENEYLFSSCLEGFNSILHDQTLADWCPDTNHGPEHGGLNHPKLRELAFQWRHDPIGWRKKYGGEPVGMQNPVYGWAQNDKWDDIANNHYLVPMPRELKEANRWILSASGADFGSGGENHPSAITVCSIAGYGKWAGQTWVRTSLIDTSGAKGWLRSMQEALAARYNIKKRMQGGDPVAAKHTTDWTGITSISQFKQTRMATVGVVRTVQLDDNLFFDADDPGVVLLFREMQRVRYKAGTDGKLEYVRVNDDMTASFEDAMVMLHGQPILKVSNRQPLPVRRYQRQLVTPRSAS